MAEETTWDAVVLAGGRARRLGGIDKPALAIGGRSLLEIALAACYPARYRVVVGPQRSTSEPVRWAQESPAGSGPLAALGAGSLRSRAGRLWWSSWRPTCLRSTSSWSTGSARRSSAQPSSMGQLVVDDQRRAQPLLAAYRRRPLERAVAALGDLRDRPVRAILERLTVAEIVDTDAADDIDTPADLARWTHDRHGRP